MSTKEEREEFVKTKYQLVDPKELTYDQYKELIDKDLDKCQEILTLLSDAYMDLTTTNPQEYNFLDMQTLTTLNVTTEQLIGLVDHYAELKNHKEGTHHYFYDEGTTVRLCMPARELEREMTSQYNDLNQWYN